MHSTEISSHLAKPSQLQNRSFECASIFMIAQVAVVIWFPEIGRYSIEYIIGHLPQSHFEASKISTGYNIFLLYWLFGIALMWSLLVGCDHFLYNVYNM